MNALNKLIRTLKARPVKLSFHPLKGPLRIVSIPDASFHGNADKSSQMGICVFVVKARKTASHHAGGNLIGFQSHKIKKQTLSTTVAELYALLKGFGIGQYLKTLWVDISRRNVPLELRTDANSLMETARTTHAPEQKETTHMIDVIRRVTSTGAIDDLHTLSVSYALHCNADSLTKTIAKPDQLIKTVNSGLIECLDLHPPFRTGPRYNALPAVLHNGYGLFATRA